MRSAVLAALCVAGAWGLWHWYGARPIAQPDGIIAPVPPQQADFAVPQAPIPFRDAMLVPLAHFSLSARVLSRHNYTRDAEADVSPTDLALGWGRMSDSAVLRRVEVWQGNRFYYWKVGTFPIPRREIETHSANMHMIPANDAVAATLKHVRVGGLVTLDGLLVEVDKPNGWHWRSSMTRDDTGNGACEVVFVEHLTTIP